MKQALKVVSVLCLSLVLSYVSGNSSSNKQPHVARSGSGTARGVENIPFWAARGRRSGQNPCGENTEQSFNTPVDDLDDNYEQQRFNKRSNFPQDLMRKKREVNEDDWTLDMEKIPILQRLWFRELFKRSDKTPPRNDPSIPFWAPRG